MKKNMGNTDRIIRFIIAALIAVLYFTGVIPGIIGIILVSLGAIFFLTSLVSFCPLYALFGLNSCPAKSE